MRPATSPEDRGSRTFRPPIVDRDVSGLRITNIYTYQCALPEHMLYPLIMSQQAAIDEELNEVAGHLNAQHARLVALTVALLADESTWADDSVWTVEQYLCWRVGISPARARQVADVARRADAFPECMTVFARGELTLDQVSAIVRKAPSWTDSEITELAKVMTVRQLQHVVGKYAFPPIPEADTAGVTNADSIAEHHHPVGADPDHDETCHGETHVEPDDRCSFHFDDDGRFHLHLETDQLTGTIIANSLTEARNALFQGGQHDVDWVDALRSLAERSVDAIASTERRNRWRINFHLDAAGGCVDAHGFSVPEAIRRYITCDGLLSPVLTENGYPVSVGRAQHIVPDRTRRLVELRDGGCRVPGCTTRHFVEVHHIIHWEHDGPTDTWNLISLCGHHHRLHHKGKLGISGNADIPGGVAFTNTAGRPIRPSGARPKPPGAPPSPPIGTYRHPDGGRMDPRWLYFTPPPELRSDAWSTSTQNPANHPDRVTALERERLHHRPDFD